MDESVEERKKSPSDCEVILIGCSSRKRINHGMAQEMYDGELFKKSVQYCSLVFPNIPWFILSAKYGLLRPDDMIDRYNISLYDFSIEQRKEWGYEVSLRLKELGYSFALMFAGERYTEFLSIKHQSIIPRMGIGKKLQWLNHQIISLSVKKGGLGLI